MDPYYPVNDAENSALYAKYQKLAQQQGNVIFGGRLGQYRYYDMDKVIRAAFDGLETLTDSVVTLASEKAIEGDCNGT